MHFPNDLYSDFQRGRDITSVFDNHVYVKYWIYEDTINI